MKNDLEKKQQTLVEMDEGRRALAVVEKERARLTDAVKEKKTAVEQLRAHVAYINSPAGIAGSNDAEIERQERALKVQERGLVRAQAELDAFVQGAAANLDQRIADLEKRRFDAAHAESRAIFAAKLSEYVKLGAKMGAIERDFEALADAAGFHRAPMHIFATAAGAELAMSSWDVWKRDIAGFMPEALPETDPQRVFIERQTGKRG